MALEPNSLHMRLGIAITNTLGLQAEQNGEIAKDKMMLATVFCQDGANMCGKRP